MQPPNLPDELLLEIFSYLSTKDKTAAARVCRRWRVVVYDKCLWRKAAFDFKNPDLQSVSSITSSLRLRKVTAARFPQVIRNKAAFKKFMNECAVFMKTIDLAFCHFSERWIPYWHPPTFSVLQSLDLSNAKLYGADLGGLINACPNLQCLKVEDLDFKDSSGTNEEILLPIICHLNQKLTDLDISWNGIRATRLFNNSDFHKPHLKRLVFKGNYEFDTRHLTDVTQTMPSLQHLDIGEMQTRNTGPPCCFLPETLKSLNMSGVKGQLPFTLIDSKSLLALDLSGVVDVCDELMRNIVSGAPNLSVLKISNCRQVTDAGANVIARNLVNLRVLFVDYVKIVNMSIFLDNVSVYLCKLRSLRCVGCNVAPSVVRSKLANSNVRYLAFRNFDWTEIKKNGRVLSTSKAGAEASGASYFLQTPND